MSISVQVRLGNCVLTKTEDGPDKECWAKLSFFSQIPVTCTECGKSNVAMNHREAKGFSFSGIKCLSCGAESTFGEYKAGGFFVKEGGKFTKYRGKTAEAKPETDPEDAFA